MRFRNLHSTRNSFYLLSDTVYMYYNYHATAKKLISDGKLTGYYFTECHRGISPALVLLFDDPSHPVMPIREYRFDEYLPLLPKDKQIFSGKL